MTRTRKMVSDMSLHRAEQVSRGKEIEDTETRKLYYQTYSILRESTRRKMNSKSMGTAMRLGLGYIINIKNYEKHVRSLKDKNFHLENSLDDALKRIPKTNAKKLFLIIEMNMKYGPEKTIEYIIGSFEKTESIEINGMTFLIGEASKVHNRNIREFYARGSYFDNKSPSSRCKS